MQQLVRLPLIINRIQVLRLNMQRLFFVSVGSLYTRFISSNFERRYLYRLGRHLLVLEEGQLTVGWLIAFRIISRSVVGPLFA